MVKVEEKKLEYYLFKLNNRILNFRKILRVRGVKTIEGERKIGITRVNK